MKKETIYLSIILPIVLAILTTIAGLYSPEIREKMNDFTRFTSPIFLTWVSIVFLLIAFTNYIRGYIKLKLQNQEEKLLHTVSSQMGQLKNELNQFRDKFTDQLNKCFLHFDSDDAEIRDEYRDKYNTLNKKIDEINNLLRDKIMVLKSFVDSEFIADANHYDAQLDSVEQRIALIVDKTKSYEPTREITDPNAIKNEKEAIRARLTRIEAYNKAFKDWSDEEFGKGKLTYHYNSRFEN